MDADNKQDVTINIATSIEVAKLDKLVAFLSELLNDTMKIESIVSYTFDQPDIDLYELMRGNT